MGLLTRFRNRDTLSSPKLRKSPDPSASFSGDNGGPIEYDQIFHISRRPRANTDPKRDGLRDDGRRKRSGSVATKESHDGTKTDDLGLSRLQQSRPHHLQPSESNVKPPTVTTSGEEATGRAPKPNGFVSSSLLALPRYDNSGFDARQRRSASSTHLHEGLQVLESRSITDEGYGTGRSTNASSLGSHSGRLLRKASQKLRGNVPRSSSKSQIDLDPSMGSFTNFSSTSLAAAVGPTEGRDHLMGDRREPSHWSETPSVSRQSGPSHVTHKQALFPHDNSSSTSIRQRPKTSHLHESETRIARREFPPSSGDRNGLRRVRALSTSSAREVFGALPSAKNMSLASTREGSSSTASSSKPLPQVPAPESRTSNEAEVVDTDSPDLGASSTSRWRLPKSAKLRRPNTSDNAHSTREIKSVSPPLKDLNTTFDKIGPPPKGLPPREFSSRASLILNHIREELEATGESESKRPSDEMANAKARPKEKLMKRVGNPFSALGSPAFTPPSSSSSPSWQSEAESMESESVMGRFEVDFRQYMQRQLADGASGECFDELQLPLVFSEARRALNLDPATSRLHGMFDVSTLVIRVQRSEPINATSPVKLAGPPPSAWTTSGFQGSQRLPGSLTPAPRRKRRPKTAPEESGNTSLQSSLDSTTSTLENHFTSNLHFNQGRASSKTVDDEEHKYRADDTDSLSRSEAARLMSRHQQSGQGRGLGIQSGDSPEPKMKYDSAGMRSETAIIPGVLVPASFSSRSPSLTSNSVRAGRAVGHDGSPSLPSPIGDARTSSEAETSTTGSCDAPYARFRRSHIPTSSYDAGRDSDLSSDHSQLTLISAESAVQTRKLPALKR